MGTAQFYEKRVLTHVSGLVPNSDIGFLVCLSQEAIQIIRNYLSGPALWETSYIKSIVSEREYETPDASEFDIIQAIVSEALFSLQGENLMPICDINEGLKYLADKLCSCGFGGGSGCTCGGGGCPPGTGGAGQTDDPPTTNTDDPTTETTPPGFDGWDDYETYKCAMCSYIISRILQDLSNLSLINLIGMTVVSLAPVIATLVLTPVPGDEIILIASLILAAWGIGEAVATVAYDLVNNASDDFLCALFVSRDVGQAVTNWNNEVTAQMETQGTATLLKPLVSGMLDTFANNTNFNKIFDKDTSLSLTPADCSGCGADECQPELIWDGGDPVVNGTYTQVDDYEYDFENGVDGFGNRWAIMNFNQDPRTGEWCDNGIQIASLSLTGFTPKSPAGYRLYDMDNNLLYSGNTPPNWDLYPDVRELMLKSSTDFTGTIIVRTCPLWALQYGSHNGTNFSSEPLADGHVLVLKSNTRDGTSHCNAERNSIAISNLSGYSPYYDWPPTTGYDFVCRSETPATPAVEYEGNTPWGSPVCCNAVTIWSATAFTCTLTVGAVC